MLLVTLPLGTCPLKRSVIHMKRHKFYSHRCVDKAPETITHFASQTLKSLQNTAKAPHKWKKSCRFLSSSKAVRANRIPVNDYLLTYHSVACAGQFNCCITQVADCYKESSKRIEDSTMESETINSANISKMELTIAPVDSKKLQIHHNTKLNSKNTSKRLARGVQHSAAI